MAKSRIFYKDGSIIAESAVSSQFQVEGIFKWDERTLDWRAKAMDYHQVLSTLPECDDLAKNWQNLPLTLPANFEPRHDQKMALTAWKESERRACVCLPTGGGKTVLAMMAIAECQIATLIVVPTKDLMQQWAREIDRFFSVKAGLIGDGFYELLPITIITYQSARLHIERFGNQFGLLIFDECHHLPGPQYQRIALASIAPFRLGLSATLERQDGGEQRIYELIGPLAYEAKIHQMIGQGLAPFDIVTQKIELSAGEQQEYLACRNAYLDFVRRMRINMSSPNGFNDFVIACSRMGAAGAAAMRAFRKQKLIPQTSMQKLKAVWEILSRHANERIIIFTDSNEQAYAIGKFFLLPVITHQTKSAERKKFLDDFKTGKVHVLLSSKVLNEGVDVPEASVAIIVSGSSVVREHVQRLGRILRQSKGKRAVLYELVSENTGEHFVSMRRRQHHAYQRSPAN